MQKNISTYIDSTFLKTAEEMNISDSENELIVFKMLDDAIRNNYACFMIRPNHVKKVCDKIKSLKSSLKVGTVVDFPLGTSSTKCKVMKLNKQLAMGLMILILFRIIMLLKEEILKNLMMISFKQQIFAFRMIALQSGL